MYTWNLRLLTGLVAVALGVGVVTPISAAAAAESEPNGTPDTATPIALAESVTGNIAATTDYDYYQFTIPQAGVVSLDFTHDALGTDSVFWRGLLLNQAGDSLCAFNSTGNQTQLSTQAMGLCEGTYYVQIRSELFTHNDAPYGLCVQYTPGDECQIPYEQEGANDTPDQAMAIALGERVTGNIHQLGDLDYYTFTLTQRQTISLQVWHDAQQDNQSYWRFMVGQGSNNIYTWAITGTTQSQLSSIPLEAGTYTLCVTNGSLQTSDGYTFQIDAQAASSSGGSGGGTTTGASQTGDTDGDGKVTIQDAYLALMAYANTAAGLADGLTATQRTAADIDGDGKVSIQDAFRILRYYADGAAGLTPSWD